MSALNVGKYAAIVTPFDSMDLDVGLRDAETRAVTEASELAMLEDPLLGEMLEYVFLNPEAFEEVKR